jgi:hypothetical protein
VASQHDINSRCCNLVGAFELSQCADCERPVLSSVPPTVKAVAAKQSARLLAAAFGMRARSEHLRQLADKCAVKAAAAQDHMTRASFEAERKQLLILAQQAEKLERQQVAGRPMTKR